MRWSVLAVSCLLSICIVQLAYSQPPGQPPGAKQPAVDWKTPESANLKNITQITADYVRAGESYFSPDMKHIIFQAEEREKNPFYQMFVMDLATKKTTKTFEKEAKEELAMREEDKKLNRRRRYQWDFDPAIKIYSANIDGSNLKCLTDAPEYNAEGSYSSDGKQIVFCSKRDGHLNLYIMDADGSNVRQLTKTKDCYNGGPFFSPDNKRVIFRADRDKKDALQLYVINVDGTEERQLTNNDGVNWCPYWHPNSKHIIYSGADHSNPNARPNYDLYLMNVETKATKRVTFAPGADVLPVFSPDGKKVMWTSTRDGRMPGSQIFIADFDVELP